MEKNKVGSKLDIIVIAGCLLIPLVIIFIYSLFEQLINVLSKNFILDFYIQILLIKYFEFMWDVL